MAVCYIFHMIIIRLSQTGKKQVDFNVIPDGIVLWYCAEIVTGTLTCLSGLYQFEWSHKKKFNIFFHRIPPRIAKVLGRNVQVGSDNVATMHLRSSLLLQRRHSEIAQFSIQVRQSLRIVTFEFCVQNEHTQFPIMILCNSFQHEAVSASVLFPVHKFTSLL